MTILDAPAPAPAPAPPRQRPRRRHRVFLALAAIGALVAATVVLTGDETARGPTFDTRAIEAALTSAVSSATGPPGVLVMITTDQGTWSKGFGVADVGTGAPITPQLSYRIGSTTKTFTAVVVLQLVGEGLLRLDTPVSAYLPGVLPYGEQVTIQQLLNHTNGLVDFDHFGPLNIDAERDVPRLTDPALREEVRRAESVAASGGQPVLSPELHVALAATRPLAFAPGSRYNYSNTGYLLLTMLVEKVTGQPLAAAYQDRIFDPLGLDHTFVATTTAFPGPYARSYLRNADGTLTDDTDDLSLGTAGAGALVSTMQDEATFLRALMRGELLPQNLLLAMREPTSLSGNEMYGLGIATYQVPCGVLAYGHGGGIGGYVSNVAATADGSTVAVYLQNAVTADEDTSLRNDITGRLICAGEAGR